MWNNINKIFGRSKGKQTITVKNADGVPATTTEELCNILNTYFATVGKNLAKNIPETRDSNPCENITSVINSVYLQPTNPNEVFLIIKDLDANKSSGADNIPPSLLKSNCLQFSRILSEMFNSMVSTGVFPDCLKLAKVIPIFKSGDADCAD